MTPSPEQIAEWRKDALAEWEKQSPATWANYGKVDNYALGYIRASTEQATELAALKAKLAGVMPLARFGSMVIKAQFEEDKEQFTGQLLKCGIADDGWTANKNIEATITKLLKDEK